jgi:hypothetical protein
MQDTSALHCKSHISSAATECKHDNKFCCKRREDPSLEQVHVVQRNATQRNASAQELTFQMPRYCWSGQSLALVDRILRLVGCQPLVLQHRTELRQQGK